MPGNNIDGCLLQTVKIKYFIHFVYRSGRREATVEFMRFVKAG